MSIAHPLASLVLLSSGVAAQCELAALPAPPGSSGSFGRAVALSGGRLFASALESPFAFGTAHVFEAAPSGWSEVAQLPPPGSPSLLGFGKSLDASGDTLVVGAGGTPFAGSVYVLEPGAGGWTVSDLVFGSDAVSGDDFGASVACDGDTLIVGSPYDRPSGFGLEPLGEGAAFVFERQGPPGSAWAETHKLVASAPVPGGHFGFSVDLDGDRAVVGAPQGYAGLPGEFYVFERTPAGWVEEARIAHPGSEPEAGFGWSVAIDGDGILVGAPRDDQVGSVDEGSAWVFRRGPAGWALEAALLLPVAAQLSRFGASVALEGDRAVVGAPNQAATGSAHLFARAGSGWGHAGEMGEGGIQKMLGRSVALGDGLALVGAPHEGAFDEGSVHVHTRGVGVGLVGSPGEVSVSAGGAHALSATTCPPLPGSTYFVLGTTSGTAPGLVVDGVTIPLTIDAWFLFTLTSPGAPPLAGTLGAFDVLGRAAAAVNVPAGLPAALAGVELHHAMLALDLGSLAPVLGSSGAVRLGLVP